MTISLPVPCGKACTVKWLRLPRIAQEKRATRTTYRAQPLLRRRAVQGCGFRLADPAQPLEFAAVSRTILRVTEPIDLLSSTIVQTSTLQVLCLGLGDYA